MKSNKHKETFSTTSSQIGSHTSLAVSLKKNSLTVLNPQTCGETIKCFVAFVTQRGMKDLTLDFADPGWYENDLDDKHVLFQLPNTCLSTMIIS